MLRLFPKGRHTIQAFDEIEVQPCPLRHGGYIAHMDFNSQAYILEMIEERQMSASNDREDLLTNLILAAQEEEEGGDGVRTGFTHQDVIGGP